MAAGRGTRLGADRPKALVPLGSGSAAEPLVTHALRGVLSCPDLSDVVVVAPPERMPELVAAVDLAREDGSTEGPFVGHDGRAVSVTVVPGGAERSDSVAAGLRALATGVGVVLVHDAARTLTPPEVFGRVVEAVRGGHPAVIPALPVADTIKAVDAHDRVVDTPDRAGLRAVQTPQGFLRETLERAHAAAAGPATDDAALVEALGHSVLVVAGDPRSLKITQAADLQRVGGWLGAPAPTAPAGARRRPLLVVLGGPPGVGKTTLARAWSRRRGAVHLRIDTIEQALLRVGATQLGPEGYAAAYAVAGDQLRLGLDVVADAVNPLPITREAWRDQAALAGARLLEVELTCATAEHRSRVEARDADIPGHRVPDWASVQAAEFQPWPEAHLHLDTTGRDVEDLVAQLEAACAHD